MMPFSQHNVCSFIIQSRRALQSDWRSSGLFPAEFLALKHESRILRHSTSPVCGFSMMEQVRLIAVWPMENLLGSSLSQIQSWTTVRKSYSHALEQGPLLLPFFASYLTGLRNALLLLMNFLCFGGTLVPTTPRNCLLGGRLPS